MVIPGSLTSGPQCCSANYAVELEAACVSIFTLIQDQTTLCNVKCVAQSFHQLCTSNQLKGTFSWLQQAQLRRHPPPITVLCPRNQFMHKHSDLFLKKLPGWF